MVFEEGVVYPARSFRSESSRHVYAADWVSLHLLWGLESWAANAWASFLSINRVKIFRRDLRCFLKVSYYKNLALFCEWRCLLRSLISRGRRGRVRWWPLHYWCLKVHLLRSFGFVMGSSKSFSSCDETQLWGWIRNDVFFAWPACLASGRSKLGRSLSLTPFFSQRT